METQLALLAQELHAVRGEVGEVRALIEGPPWERSVRGRLHTLEAESAASKVASAALAEARTERRRSQVENEQARVRRRGARRWAVGATVTFGAAAYPYLAHFAHWTGS